MIVPQALAQITFPVQLDWAANGLKESHWLKFCCQLLEMRLIRALRFEQGKVRSTSHQTSHLACAAVLPGRSLRFPQVHDMVTNGPEVLSRCSSCR